VAAVSYVGCGSDRDKRTPVGNLMPPPEDSGIDARDGSLLDVVANLVAPFDSGVDQRGDRGIRDGSPLDVVANLVAPDIGLE
jgi:hypothetical protein